MSYYYGYGPNDYLCHYGVQGMKWGQHLIISCWSGGLCWSSYGRD